MNFDLPNDLVIWQKQVREFVRAELQPHDAAIERTGRVPPSAMAGLRRMGLFGTNTPTQYGGLGLSSGRTIGAFALTEPGAGSDAARITTAVRQDGASHYIIDG